METRVGKLKTDFNDITSVRTIVIGIFDSLQQKMTKLKTLYNELILSNEDQVFIFGLDSFYFQGKLIDIEYDDMQRLFKAINNRMYCEYFKLYRIIVGYTIDTIADNKVIELIKLSDFPLYRDLEPFKEYDWLIVSDLHENILILLSAIINYIDTKENELVVYDSKRISGLNIDNFVSTFKYDITVKREKILLFLTYIEFFHKLHSKYLRRFSHKIQLMHSHVDSDIRFETKTNILREISADASLLTEMGMEFDDDSVTDCDFTNSIGTTEPIQPKEVSFDLVENKKRNRKNKKKN